MLALLDTGSSIVIGVVANKLIAIIMLAFASSTLFRLYYFRMYLLIIMIGAFNGLFLLPVILSWIGPPTDKIAVLEQENDAVKMLSQKYSIISRH